jgi:hypothetical protein
VKKLLVLCCLLSGCAALRGQAKYAGTGTQPTIKEHIVRYPETPRPGLSINEKQVDEKDKPKEAMRSYWDMPADKVATVANPLDKAIKTHVECFASFPSSFDFVVPAHTTQDMLFTTNAQYMYDTLCQIAHYEVVEESK